MTAKEIRFKNEFSSIKLRRSLDARVYAEVIDGGSSLHTSTTRAVTAVAVPVYILCARDARHMNVSPFTIAISVEHRTSCPAQCTEAKHIVLFLLLLLSSNIYHMKRRAWRHIYLCLLDVLNGFVDVSCMWECARAPPTVSLWSLALPMSSPSKHRSHRFVCVCMCVPRTIWVLFPLWSWCYAMFRWNFLGLL